jgi:hypothetical protein
VTSFDKSAAAIQSKYRQELSACENEKDSVIVESVAGDPNADDMCPFLPVVFISSPAGKLQAVIDFMSTDSDGNGYLNKLLP